MGVEPYASGDTGMRNKIFFGLSIAAIVAARFTLPIRTLANILINIVIPGAAESPTVWAGLGVASMLPLILLLSWEKPEKKVKLLSPKDQLGAMADAFKEITGESPPPKAAALPAAVVVDTPREREELVTLFGVEYRVRRASPDPYSMDDYGLLDAIREYRGRVAHV
jgi:hypothetical protein